MTSKYTKKLKLKSLIFDILSILLMFGPLIVYTAIAFSTATVVENKAILTSLSAVAISIAAGSIIVAFVNRTRYKAPQSILWIMVLAFYICIDRFLGCILVIGICAITNEIIVRPLSKYLRFRKRVNKEIDKRY